MSEHKFLFHENEWFWGRTTTIISRDGVATVELQYDDKYPSTAFVKGLIVLKTFRRQGYASDLMRLCDEAARNEGRRFLQLNANKEQRWLVQWYESLGYTIIYTDENEHTMLKVLDMPFLQPETVRNKETEQPKKRESKKFVKPTVEEIRAYCAEKGYDIDPEAFFAFYESNGWKVGKNPMKNWKMACVTWLKNNNNQNKNYGRETITDKIRRDVREADLFSQQIRENIGNAPELDSGDNPEIW